jgi:hypothetical protein
VATRTVGAEVSITAGTLFGEYDSQAVTGADAGLAYIDDVGTSNNRVILKHFNGRANGVIRSGGTDQADMLSANAFTANVMTKSATTYALNDFAVLLGGQTIVTDVSGSVPVSLDRMRLGNDPIAAINLFGHIRRLDYFPSRLSNAQLQQMTA